MKIRFEDNWMRCDNWLQFPQCGEEYLHQGVVKAYSRKEDEPTMLTKVNEDGLVHQIMAVTDNPSNRRHAVEIHFYCEECDLDANLTIGQHKGSTFIYWGRKEKGGAK
jgi:hypothetical protein